MPFFGTNQYGDNKAGYPDFVDNLSAQIHGKSRLTRVHSGQTKQLTRSWYSVYSAFCRISIIFKQQICNTIVNNYLLLMILLHITMPLHHPRGVLRMLQLLSRLKWNHFLQVDVTIN